MSIGVGKIWAPGAPKTPVSEAGRALDKTTLSPSVEDPYPDIVNVKLV